VFNILLDNKHQNMQHIYITELKKKLATLVKAIIWISGFDCSLSETIQQKNVTDFKMQQNC